MDDLCLVIYPLPNSPLLSDSVTDHSHRQLDGTAMSTDVAFQTFNLANEVFEVAPQDEIYRFDVEANRQINREAPWTKECVSSSWRSAG